MTPKPGFPSDRSCLVRFGVFEFDLTNLELKRDGRLVSTQQQPALLLQFLVIRASRVVTREELKNAIWPTGTYVEFDYGLNTAINRIRRALGDSAEEPRFIQTIPRVGYRFVAPVEYVISAADEVQEPLGEAAVAVLASPGAAQLARPRPARQIMVVLALTATFALAALLLWKINQEPAGRLTSGDGQVLRYSIPLPPQHVVLSLAISPRGDQIVYESMLGGTTVLFRRFLDSDQSRLIAGSEGAYAPFFSPDGSQVGFYASQKLRVATPSGVRDLAGITGTSTPFRAFWADDGNIYFNNQTGLLPGIWRTPAKGGAAELIASGAETVKGTEFIFPQQLISGANSLLYSTSRTPRDRGIRVLSLPSGRTDPVLSHGMGGQYLRTGHLLYYWAGNLMAVPFDGRRLRVSGSPVQVVPAVAAHGWDGPVASVSGNGTLVYLTQPEPDQRTLAWIDRNGAATALPIAPAAFEQAEISPDGGKLAVVRRDGPDHWSLLIHDLRTREWSLLRESAVPRLRAIWSPDSRSLAVSSEQQNGDFVNLYRVYLDPGKVAERLTEQPDFGQFPTSWSAQANAILFAEGVHPATQGDLFALPLDGRRRPIPFVTLPGWDSDAVFSPDGRWVAYSSEQSGKAEVFVQSYPQNGAPVRLSASGGTGPLWRNSGSILYVDPGTGVMEVAVQDGRKLREPTRMFAADFLARTDIWTRAYSLAPDGRLLVIRPVGTPGARIAQIQVVVNWFQKLKELLPQP
jgi:DNA-binding winged helix-turn-helix (wHTH) protein/Tol biopolymer transport system component